jgi:hypothetical protein
MPLNKEIVSSLTYLRKKYKVSERDLVALAKKLQVEPENEETWEEITRNYLKQRRIRQLSRATR